MNKVLMFLRNPGMSFFTAGVFFSSFIVNLGESQVLGLVTLLLAVYMWHIGNAAYDTVKRNVFSQTILDIARGKLVIEKKPEGVFIRANNEDD